MSLVLIPELGHFALILALFLCIPLAILPQLGAMQNRALWMHSARPLAYGSLFFHVLAFACLSFAFLQDDFTVRYVAEHSNSHLPVQYKFSALWGGHEGSLLLWSLILSAWTVAVALKTRELPLWLTARVLSVMGLIGVGFLLFLLLTSNPFDRYLPLGPSDGSDLNPLLQDPGLIFHPPMLYMGYVGFSVAFAFAVAGLQAGQMDSAWARWCRPWTNVAWAFLTLGIALGSWWAYYELGWGGWWFWDPVENASLMPWLVGTALVHSLAASEKRGAFKSWTILLAIFAFSLSLLGTFLVRSGVLTSVHAFANDPERGVFILIFLLVVVGGALSLFALRAHQVKSSAQFSGLSREVLLLCNNVILAIIMAVVLLGTLYPLIVDAFGWGKISVGPPYFNTFFVPLVLCLGLLMGGAPLLNWKRDSLQKLRDKLSLTAIVSVVFGCLLPLLWSEYSWLLALAWTISLWIILGALTDYRYRLRHKGLSALFSLNLSYYAMLIAHMGVALAIAGAALTSIHSEQRDLRFAAGDSYTLAGYEFTLLSSGQRRGENFIADWAEIKVSGNADLILRPEKRRYLSGGNPMTESAIDAGFSRDLYVSLASKLEGDAWALRVQVKPGIRWVWLGALLMALGGLLAVFDTRYKKKIAKPKRTSLGGLS